MNKKKAAFLTLGCKVNLYDTQAMEELFLKKGYEITDFDDKADVYLINTCSVTNFGDRKSRQSIHRARAKNKDAIIVAAGCYAQTSAEKLADMEGINIILGTQNRSNVVELVESYNIADGVKIAVNKHTEDFEPLSISSMNGRTRAYIKIQEGCNQFCTYCIIPYARGPVRSRRLTDICDEAKRLAQNNFKEIVLTGIHVASYGIDLKNENFPTLLDVLKAVHATEGIERIRLSSLEPKIITDEFIEMIKRFPKLCRHFHLSLQSGCDSVLKRMNRRYTSEEYMLSVLKLRKAFGDVGITTDIIVGFPGETEKDFLISFDFVKKAKLSKLHVFPYSPKIGTPAAKFSNQITNEEKSRRSKIMCNLSNELSKKFVESFKGEKMDVLFEKKISHNTYEGHTSNYITIRAESPIDISNTFKSVVLERYLSEETASAVLI